MRPWYRFQAKVDNPVAEIFIYDDIGKSFFNDEAVSAAQFIADLAAVPASAKTVRVRVNSGGGNPFEATAIANALRVWQQAVAGRVVETHIDGIAASAATIVTSAGNPIYMADNAVLMVHEPEGIEAGRAADMRLMADALDTVRDAIIATYRWVSSKTVDELSALMTATTWMDAPAAKANGFATDIVQGQQIAACLRPEIMNRLGEIPEPFKARVDALLKKPTPAPVEPVVATTDEILAAVDAAGLETAFARSLAAAKLPMEQVAARITDEKNLRTAATARASQITALCATAKQPELAAGYIKGAMSIDDVRAHLTTITAKLDQVEIDAGLSPDHGVAKKPAALSAAGIYADRNRMTTH